MLLESEPSGFMNDKGEITHIYYEDPENGSAEIPYEGSRDAS